MLQDVRRASRGVFAGATYRLEIAAAIHALGRETFSTRELRAVLHHDLANANNLDRNLKALSESGVLQKLPGEGWYRAPSRFFELCARWHQELLEQKAKPRPMPLEVET